MDLDDQFDLEHILLKERKCRVCGEIKDLIDGYYLTRKGRGDIPSAYSYECKICTCLLYTSPSPRDNRVSRMPSSA